MDIKNFKAGTYRPGYKYRYFLPEKINHSFVWKDQGINELLEGASFKLGLRRINQIMSRFDALSEIDVNYLLVGGYLVRTSLSNFFPLAQNDNPLRQAHNNRHDMLHD